MRKTKLKGKRIKVVYNNIIVNTQTNTRKHSASSHPFFCKGETLVEVTNGFANFVSSS